jgi:hypothetical protein
MAKEIGVLTFHNGPNFGGFMQAWHVVHAIRRLGYRCNALNYLHPVHQEANKIRLPVRSLDSLKGRIYWFLKQRPFRGIGNTLCKDRFTTDPGKVPWKSYDGLVVGSDIVWDYQNTDFGHDPAYFGALDEQKGTPIGAYAASCGPADPEGPFPDYVKEGLHRVSFLGVRDRATANMVENASGRQSELVVDPTWLGGDLRPKRPRLPKSEYVLVYGGRVDPGLSECLHAYCRRKGLKLVSALTSCRHSDIVYRSLHPFQWVDLFRNATATFIVGTLHGTLFSIKYGKPFILVNDSRIAPKIREAIKRTGQEFRVFDHGKVEDEALNLLDRSVADPPLIPDEWRLESVAFLERSLKEF